MENPLIYLWEAAGTGTRLERLAVAGFCGFLASVGTGVVIAILTVNGLFAEGGLANRAESRFVMGELGVVVASLSALLWAATIAMILRALTCPSEAARGRGARSLFTRDEVPR